MEGNFHDNCNGCLPQDILTESDYYYWMTEGGCGVPMSVGGMLDGFLDYLLQEVRPQAEMAVNARLFFI